MGTTSAPATMTVTNSGDAPLGIWRSRTTEDFAVSHDCGGFLDPGAFCTFAVTFAPQTAGPRSGTLTIETGAGNLSVALSGNGFLLPTIQLWPSALTFAQQAVGTSSAVRSVTLTNTGAIPVTISAIQPSAQFGVVHNCGSGVNALASCTIDVFFTPQVRGEVSGSITIESSAAGSPHTIPVDGFGVWLELSPAPGTLAFAELPVDTPSDPRTVTVTNVGEAAVDVGALIMAGTDPESFELQNDQCSGTQLAVDSSCTFKVVFRPPILGKLEAEVRISSNSSTSPDLVSLTGGNQFIFLDGFESGDTSVWSQTVSSLKLDFGVEVAGDFGAEQTFTISTFAKAAELGTLEITGADADGFLITDDQCSGAFLKRRTSCSVTVVFSPFHVGGHAARIEVPGGSHTVPRRVELTGGGTY
ncbi:MAG: choice-of-anchor D domain-containing protein [bacterium]|nr:choice-of-anchor D domain-containing protein [bacterium]